MWTASTQAGWITIMPPGSGQGDGSVSFRVGENPDPIPRQGTLVVNDKSVELSEAAAPCAFTVGSNTGVVGAEGGTLTIDVRTNAACSWTASTDAPWATPSPESGKGTQTVRVAVAPNSGSERSARATIANQQLAFSQRGAAPVPPPPAPAPAPSASAGTDAFPHTNATGPGTSHSGTASSSATDSRAAHSDAASSGTTDSRAAHSDAASSGTTDPHPAHSEGSHTLRHRDVQFGGVSHRHVRHQRPNSRDDRCDRLPERFVFQYQGRQGRPG